MGQFARLTAAQMTDLSTKYEAYFEDARKRAQQAIDPVESVAWLRIANKWLRRLAQPERRRDRARLNRDGRGRHEQDGSPKKDVNGVTGIAHYDDDYGN